MSLDMHHTNTSLEMLATYCDVPKDTALSWIRGEALPESKQLTNISRALDIHIDYLKGAEDVP